MMEDGEIALLAEQLGHTLTRQSMTVTTAESCTGGLVAAAITSVAGSSAWFETGFVTYANASKTSLLGVAVETLDRHGAVSEAVVVEMSRGACERASAGVGVAVSGIAGPGGGNDAKPVGTVWLAWARQSGPIVTSCFQFDGDRRRVREQAVVEALRGTLSTLSNTW